LCTEEVFLNEGRWRRKWTWNRETREKILEAQKGEKILTETIFWGKETLWGVTVGVVIIVSGILAVKWEKQWASQWVVYW